MVTVILISGVITALVLFGASFLIPILVSNVAFLSFLSLYVDGNIVSLIILALIMGVINALVVPFVANVFKSAKGIWLFIITLAIDVAALLLVSMFFDGLGMNWQTAIVMALLLSWINPVANAAGGGGRRRR